MSAREHVATSDGIAAGPRGGTTVDPHDRVTLTPAEQAVASGLAPFRARLDEIDEQLVDLLGERFRICREVAVHKAEHEIAMMQPGRVEMVRARYLRHGAEVDLPADFTGGFFDLMIAATCRAEDELMERLAAEGAVETPSAESARSSARARAAADADAAGHRHDKSGLETT